MLPANLKDIAKDRQPPQLFWVVKNGIKMTGMPSFGSIEVLAGPGNLNSRGVRQEDADRVGSGLQGVDSCPVRSG